VIESDVPVLVSGEFFPEGLHPDAPSPEREELEVAPGLAVARTALTPASLASVAEGLRARATALSRLAPDMVAAALGKVHALWSASESLPRTEAVVLLRAVTGYPEPLLDGYLRRLFQAMSRERLRQWLRVSAPSSEPRVRAVGTRLTGVIGSGNIPGAALPSVVQALLLRSPCLVKTASAEPVLLPLYARTLQEVAPELAAGLVVTGWSGGDAELEVSLLERVEALAAYGSDATLADLRARLPLRTRFLPYGHRVSFAGVSREALTPEHLERTTRRAALDIALFDQQGCLSPQAIYVECGGLISPELFAEALAGALERLEYRLPRRPLFPDENAAIHQYRAEWEMRALSTPGAQLRQSATGTRWTVALDPEPRPGPCPLNRTAILRPLHDLEEMPGVLEASGLPLLSVTLASPTDRHRGLVRALAEVGVTRIAPLGRAQDPTDLLFHDGLHGLAAMARFVTLE
jgi:hypothetical protein